MLLFISALTAGAKEQIPWLNAGLISQAKTLLIDIKYNYITHNAYPPAVISIISFITPSVNSEGDCLFLLTAKH